MCRSVKDELQAQESRESVSSSYCSETLSVCLLAYFQHLVVFISIITLLLRTLGVTLVVVAMLITQCCSEAFIDF